MCWRQRAPLAFPSASALPALFPRASGRRLRGVALNFQGLLGVFALVVRVASPLYSMIQSSRVASPLYSIQPSHAHATSHWAFRFAHMHSAERVQPRAPQKERARRLPEQDTGGALPVPPIAGRHALDPLALCAVRGPPLADEDRDGRRQRGVARPSRCRLVRVLAATQVAMCIARQTTCSISRLCGACRTNGPQPLK